MTSMNDYEITGNLDFITVKAKRIPKKTNQVLYSFNNKELTTYFVGKEYFLMNGYNALHAGLNLWKSLLIKLFYKELNLDKNFKKLDSYDDDYYFKNREKISKRLDYLYLNDLKIELLISEVKTKFDEKIFILVDLIDKTIILKILDYLLRDYIHHSNGFPSLMVFNDEKLFFAEVKSENNPLIRNQIKKHKFLLKNSIDIAIVRINNDANKFKKLYDDSSFKPKTFIEKYEQMLDISDEVYDELLDYNIDELLNNEDSDYIIAFFNVIHDFDLNDKIKILNDYRQVEDLTLKNLDKLIKNRIMVEGKKLEDRKDYEDAIDVYLELKDNRYKYVSFERICMCYRKMGYFKEEISLIQDCINDESIPVKNRKKFKKRFKRLIKRNKKIKSISTSNICPECGNVVDLKNIKNRCEFYTCSNNDCCWFGGFI